MIAEESILTNNVLKQILESISTAIIIADKEGNFVLWNDKADDILKMQKTSNFQQWIEYYSIYHMDKVTEYKEGEAPILRALAGESITGEKIWVKNKNIEGLYLTVDAFPLLEKENIVGSVAIFSDITEKLRMEMLFAEFAERFEHIKQLLTESILSK